MKQDAFEAHHAATWDRFEQCINLLARKGGAKGPEAALRDEIGQQFPAMYRQVCHHLSLARTRHYSTELQQRLNQLALEGHQHLYRSRTTLFSSIGRFLAIDFAAAFRKRWRFMLTSSLMFYVPAIGMALAMQFQPELIYSLLAPDDVSRMEEMYDPANRILGRERQSDTDAYMFGFYIYNNISIGFQTFAGGLLFGIGSLFYLIFNGLILGAVATHLTAMGFTGTFWPFVAGHSAFELTAIVIFGGVGLMLGYGAIAPGRKNRWHAIRDQAISGMPLVYGGGLMLVAAAFVEAFWSSTTWPPLMLKYVVGGALWILVGLYFGLMGRNES